MLYLSSPYHHPDKVIMHKRFHQVCQATAQFMKKGVVVYSPIAHNHYIACNFNLPRDWAFWEKFDLEILKRCSTFCVLQLPGWDESTGIKAEMEFAGSLGLSIDYVTLEDTLQW